MPSVSSLSSLQATHSRRDVSAQALIFRSLDYDKCHASHRCVTGYTQRVRFQRPYHGVSYYFHLFDFPDARNIFCGGHFAEIASREIRAEKLAETLGRPFEYINGKLRKDDYAKEIAKPDGITQGLICVLRILEPCQSFKVIPAEKRPKHG